MKKLLLGFVFFILGIASFAQTNPITIPDVGNSYRGSALDPVGDVNADGFPDFIAGAWLDDTAGKNSGRAYVISGKDQTIIRTINSPSPEAEGWFGYSVASGYDLDADGINDFIVGAPGETGGAVGAGKVYVFSGASGTFLFKLTSPNPVINGNFGNAVLIQNDLDGNGVKEIIVAAYQEVGSGINAAGQVHIFNGNSFRNTIVSGAPEELGGFGWRLATAGNFLGKQTLIVSAIFENPGASPSNSGAAYAFNMANPGSPLLQQIQAGTPSLFANFGWSVTSYTNPVTGASDLLIIDGSGVVNVIHGDGSHGLEATYSGNSITTGNFNKNSQPDFATISQIIFDIGASSTITNLASGGFGYFVYENGFGDALMTLGDVNGDGANEIVAFSSSATGASLKQLNSDEIQYVTSFTPVAGVIGSVVKIKGTQFSPTPANNVVRFGPTSLNATITVSTDSTIFAIVPTGATTAPITVGSTTTGTVNFTVLPPQDSLALVAFYNATNGPGWTNKTNWLTGPLNTWFGVKTSGGRVKKLSLNSNGLTGHLPQEIGELTAMDTLNVGSNQLSGSVPPTFITLSTIIYANLAINKLTSMPDLTSLSAHVLFLNVSNNSMELNYLEPNATLPGFIVGNQSISVNINFTPASGSSLTINPLIPGTASGYQWQKDLVDISGATSLSYSIPSVAVSDVGKYTLNVASSIFAGTTITYSSFYIDTRVENLFTWVTSGPVVTDGSNTQNYSGCWGDYDNDGDEDLIVTNFSANIPSFQYQNNGDGTFTKITTSTIAQDVGNNRFGVWGDLNNDGKIDFTTGVNLFLNQGAGVFTKIPHTNGGGSSAIFGDYDNDGKLDIAYPELATIRLENSKGTILDVGPSNSIGSSNFIDFNNDNYLDIFQGGAGSGVGKRSLYKNKGDGTFSEQTTNLIELPPDGNRGGAWFDFDNDGDLDLFSSNQGTPANGIIFINDGAGNFTSTSFASVIGEDINSRASTFGDIDNDGDLDFIAFRGITTADPPSVYLNNNKGTFSLLPTTIQTFQGAQAFGSFSLADYDNNGFLDLFVGNFGDSTSGDGRPNSLYKNNGNSNHWIKLRLKGKRSNRSGIGTKIKSYAGGNLQYRQLTPITGFASPNSLLVHFGYGSLTTIDSLQVIWPSGTVQVLKNISPDNLLNVTESVPLDTDSLALVKIFNSLNGANWTANTNWLTGPVDTWFGVTVQNYQVVALKLPSNKLSGALPIEIGTLAGLKILDLSGNQITGSFPIEASNIAGIRQIIINDNKISGLPKLTSLTALDSLLVQNNNLAFGDLEPNLTIPVFTYAPQDSVDLAESLLKQINDTQTFSAVLSGTANAYQWQKNGTAIAGETNTSLTLSNISFKDDATYTYAATSSIVPALTLFSHKKILRVSSLQRDSIALVALFLATDGNAWTNHANWATTPIGTGNWFGVTISNNRVVAVNLPSNNLSGPVPLVFADVQELTTVDLSSNLITSLPDLSTLPNLVSLNVSSNQLDFASLIANVAIAGINYPNQAKLGVPIDTLVTYGTNYNLNVSTKGAGNLYQWTRNGSSVTGASDSTFVITAINRGNMGTYVCEITNPLVPALTLKTYDKKVKAVARLAGKFVLPDSTAINQANIILFKINLIGAYDTTRTQAIAADGTFVLDRVILDDYEILGKPDTIAFPTALPSYYKSTIFWEAADTLSVFGNRSGLTIVDVAKPSPLKGSGVISGTLEDAGTSTSGGRVKAARRIADAGVAASRSLATGRPTGTGYVLVAYTLTDSNGNFSIGNLPTGNYRLNIQYPGYPMDTTSFINFSIGSSPSTKQVVVAAKVDKNKIVVTLLKITGLDDADNRFTIYPNPARIAFNITLNQPLDDAQYSISNLQGQKVKAGALNPLEPNLIDVSLFTPGMYLVELSQHGKAIKNFKIVIE